MENQLPTRIKKEVLKEKIGERRLMRMVFEEQEFYFQSITKDEYQNILIISNNNKELIEDNICQVALLEPEDYVFKESSYAGLSHHFSKVILNNSLFYNVGSYGFAYNKYKQEMNQFKNQCIAIIKSQFSEFSFEEMEEWPLEKIFKYVTRAEYIFNLNKPEEQKIDLSLSNGLEETEEELTQDEIYERMIENGIDPVVFESQSIKYENKEIDEGLVIGGSDWNNEENIDEIRRQMEKSNTKY